MFSAFYTLEDGNMNEGIVKELNVFSIWKYNRISQLKVKTFTAK